MEDDEPDDRPVLRMQNAPMLVRDVFEAKGFRIIDDEDYEDDDPELKGWHVMWKGGRFKPSEYETANCVQRVNHYPKTMGITKKDCLLRNLRRMKATHGPIYAFFPESYILPSEYQTMWRVCEQHARDRKGTKPIWILKPTDSSQGRKIFLIRDISEISYGHFSEEMAKSVAGTAEPRRLGEGDDPKLDDKGRAIASELDMATTLKMLKSRLHKTVTPCVKFTEMHIAQRYLERPLCFCGYKLDLRIYVLLVSARPLRIYWFNDCLVRFATQKYDLNDLDNNYAHLTNTSINKHSTSYTTVKEGIRGGCKWSLHNFNRENPSNPLASPVLWSRIKAIVNLTLLSIAAQIPDNGGCFELFGYDVMVDDALRPWLLEVNCSPALGCEEAADREVKEPLVADMVDLIEYQRAQAAVAAPVGGGARAARARGGGARGGASSAASAPSMAEASSRRGGVAAQQQTISGAAADDGSKKAARLSMRSKAAAAERVNSMPDTFGGYELIFPFNAATTKLASSVDGSEGTIVSEIRAQLQTETSRHHHQQDQETECEEAEGEEPGMATNEAAHGGGGGGGGGGDGGREYGANYAAAPPPGKGRLAAAALAHPRVAKGVHRGNGKGGASDAQPSVRGGAWTAAPRVKSAGESGMFCSSAASTAGGNAGGQGCRPSTDSSAARMGAGGRTSKLAAALGRRTAFR